MAFCIQAADDSDLAAALEVVRAHRLPFRDAMLWASAQRAGVRCLLTEEQDGFILQSVRFVNPFKRMTDRLIDEVLPPVTARRRTQPPGSLRSESFRKTTRSHASPSSWKSSPTAKCFFPKKRLIGLEHELFSFPNGRFDDQVDAHPSVSLQAPKALWNEASLRDGAPFHGCIGRVQRCRRPLMSNLLCGRKPTDPHRLRYPRLKMAAAVPRLANCRQLASKSDSLLSDLSERARPLLRRLILWGE